MATDWAADVKKYAPGADDGVIAGIVRYCGIALKNPDSSLVSFTDPRELERVRNNFLRKKLGLTQADKALDAAIAKVGEKMKADRTRNRVTVYYLLAAHFKKLAVFAPKAKTPAKKAAAGTAAAKAPVKKAVAPAKKATTPAKKAAAKKNGSAGKTASPAPGSTSAATQPLIKEPATPRANSAAPAPAPSRAKSAGPADTGTPATEGLPMWIWWLFFAVLAAFCVWWLFLRAPA